MDPSTEEVATGRWQVGTELRARLRHVRWIGGGSGAGKSTVARRLADRHSLRLYSRDDVHADHTARTDPAEMPLTNAFRAMDMDERWVNRSPGEMLETFHWFHGEGFDMDSWKTSWRWSAPARTRSLMVVSS